MTAYQRILLAGPTGAGKTTQTWTLPGKKYDYIFEPNAMMTLDGCPDLEVAEFLPEFTEMDATLKGFRKGAKDDKPASRKEPTLYMRWVEHINKWVADEEYKNYDWLIFDSLTYLAKSCMDRQMYINNRYGDIEELPDYRVVGSKLTDIFNNIFTLPIHIMATCHLQNFQDDKTKRIVEQIFLPGKSRTMLPLGSTNTWLASARVEGNKRIHEIRTVPDGRGLQEIRSCIRGLDVIEDVTIKDFSNPTAYGVGAILTRSEKNAVHKRAS